MTIGLVMLDRDGVLNRRLPGDYVTSWDHWDWLPGARETLADICATGVATCLITNQSAIGRGRMTEDDLAAIHTRMAEDLAPVGARIDAIFHCPHTPDDACTCRKPAPGLLLAALAHFNLPPEKALFVGDAQTDEQAAATAGVPFLRVPEQQGLNAARTELLNLLP